MVDIKGSRIYFDVHEITKFCIIRSKNNPADQFKKIINFFDSSRFQ